MLEVGRWALFEACGQLASWRREGRRVERIAVNVAAEQLDSGRLADDVFDALAAAGVPASSLVLELTERQLLDGAEVVDAQLHLLAAQGVQLALDDFGTGWSSLGYLTRVPVTQLKIDKLFIERVVQDGPDRLVVDAICRVATGLGLTTVAEGVERPDQLAVARALGVTAAQGYLLSHPVPADEVAPLLGSTLVGAPGLLPGGPGRGPAAIRG